MCDRRIVTALRVFALAALLPAMFAATLSATVALLSPTPALAAGFGTVEGTVMATETAEPLRAVIVVVEGTTLGASTGMDGRYSISRVPAGRHRILASMIGYKFALKEVQVGAGIIATVNFELEEDVIRLGEIVVTGTRTPRYIKEVPVRTEVITSQAIEEKGAVNLYEALEGLPGVRVEQQCSYCNFSMVRVQGLGADHVQVLIDGQPTFSGLAGVYGLQQVPTGNIERIEVVKGAGSALYGSSAIAGVINIITKKPTMRPTLTLSTSFGENNTNDFALSASTKSKNWDAIVTAQKNSGDEIDENGNGLTDRVKTDNVALGGIVNWYGLLGDDELSLTGRTINEARQGGELATFENPFAESAEHIKTTRYEAGFTYEKAFSCGSQFVANFSHAQHNRNATNDGFLGDYIDTHDGSFPSVDEMAPYRADEKLYVADVHYSHPLTGGQRLLAGVQYSHNKLDETGRYVIVDEGDVDHGETYTSEAEKHADDVGFYVQDEISITSNFDVVAGARYDIHRSQDDFGGSGKVAPKQRIGLEYEEQCFNPRVALRLRVSDVSLRASVGTGFRVPYGFSEDLHLCSGSPRVNKPAELESEKSISYNLGIDYSKDRYTVNANFFRTELENKIDFADASETSKQLGYTYEWANIGDAYTQGVELGTRALLSRDVVIDANFTYTDAQYDKEREDWVEAKPQFAQDSKHISRVPRTAGGVKLSYSPREWNLILDVNYTGRMYVDYYEEEDIELPGSKIKHTDAFVVVNARIAKAIPSIGVTPFLGAKNLFDYVQDEKHPDDAAFMYAPYTGRTIYGGFELSF